MAIYYYCCYTISLLSISIFAGSIHALAAARPVAIVTGGTRGIGSGISTALAEAGYDLLLTYNTNKEAAEAFASGLKSSDTNNIKIICVGGDISLPETRDKIFACLDSAFGSDVDGQQQQPLKALIHNAGQYVGITSENSDGLTSSVQGQAFGDGSMLNEDGSTNFDSMHYYQRMYGEAFVDLCERGLVRMAKHGTGGSIVGTSSPGVTAALYGPSAGYSMPGAGKCLMEYSMRIYAVQAAKHNINVNIVVPGLVKTEAWKKLAQSRGMPDETVLMNKALETGAPIKSLLEPRDIGNLVAFLCSRGARFITGTVIPCDGGLHLKR